MAYLFLFSSLTTGNGADDEEGLRSRSNLIRERSIWRLMRQVFFAGKVSQKRAALLCDVVADRPGQDRIASLEHVQDRPLCHRTIHFELHLVTDPRQRPQVRREYDADHGSVWTSTDSTAGRSWTIAFQLSPASAEQYTCPPVVPKYTPQGSSESTAMASRNTLT